MTINDGFVTTYDRSPAGIWSAPGRVNLIGEHTDYNDGFVLPFAIAARTSVALALRDDGVLQLRSVQQPTGDVSVRLAELAPGRPDGWAAYVAGVIWALRGAGYDVPGLDVLVDGRVPLGSGLSSSHALECAVGLAVNDLLGLGLDVNDIAKLSHTTENQFVGAPTGMMDQLASLRCTQGHALFLDIRSLEAEQVPLDPDPDGLALLVVDTRVHHGNADGAYGERRATCEQAAKILGVAALRDVSEADLSDALDRLESDEQRRRVRHVVTENGRVVASTEALRRRDWQAVGELMNASHVSLRDDYEVSCAELDVAVESLVAAGAVGARMTGGGFGGSAVALLPVDSVERAAAAVTAAFSWRGWAAPNPFVVSASAGAHRDS
jgi:galactokinase